MNSIIGRNIRRLRWQRGYTQSELGKRARISQGRICRLEIGNENPTLTSLSRIARALEVETAELLRS
ncbi:helix-turn-helix domain-containing protein [Thiohalocapsa marina]|uniref:Helix-turn-helix domain-containing protein n=1 Tax=Thiohalocapsa marina TaxID=424902 RepID=A0A5M8FP84_9GAMM|nr:helix-turn-helix domain-containing protein [Thiohalocapsa marina]KAA6184235.1 helix-turn-helix domain-containing protein [Thiohalocapsa marina]